MVKKWYHSWQTSGKKRWSGLLQRSPQQGCMFTVLSKPNPTKKVLHREPNNFKEPWHLDQRFDNLKCVCIPYFTPNLFLKAIISLIFS
jgi:hypothetical protein